ncbi:MAG: WYL domain-containing protein [Lentisphaerae bacterium]|nr:WYL domain-containing protein [Lentisphaerota bacterium]
MRYQRYRTKFHHLILIDRAIRDDQSPSSKTIARELEVSDRTVRRNVEFMRHVLSAPIAYDPSRKGYHYTDRNWSLPGLRVSEGELLGLALAQLALQAYGDTPLGKYVRQISEKIQAALPDEIDISPKHLAGLFRFSLGPVTPFRPEHWEVLATAARKQHTVWMRYHALYRDDAQEREVDPYLLRCCGGDWYLIGYDHHTGHIPVFNIGRIRELRATRKSFDVRADFDPDSYFADTLQVSHRGERHKVRVQFFDLAARLVAEKIWHPSQKLTRKRDGSVVLEMTLSDLDEVARWVLSFGADALVLRPTDLRDLVATVATATASRYSENTKAKQQRSNKDV